MSTVILSSPLGFAGRTIRYEEIAMEDVPFSTAVHYIGHPATRALIEALGAVHIPGLWTGPQNGEIYYAVPLARSERPEGWTTDQAITSITDLRAIRCTVVEYPGACKLL